MKKNIFFLIFLSFATIINALADDVIILKNGDVINGTVTEASSIAIKYKMTSNPNGPTYSTNRAEVLSIKYSNGEVEKFDSSMSISQSNVSEEEHIPVKALAAEDNSSELLRYASLPRLNIKSTNKVAKEFFPIMAFTDSSVISTKDLTIMVEPQAVEYYDGGWKVKIGYTFCIINKTERPIYIDRANCFRRYNNFESKSYFDNSQTVVTHGNSSGGGVGLGVGSIGIGVGSSSSSSHSEIIGVDRFLIIGPKSKANLVDYKHIRLSETKAKFKTVTDIEYWGFSLSTNERVNQGEVKTYTEDNTPYSNKYFITYSTDPNFNHAYTIEFELYAKFLVGASMKQNIWSMISPEARIVEEYKKTIPDFWTDSFAIIGMMGEYTK